MSDDKAKKKAEEEREEHWKNWKIPRMTDGEIRKFVDDFVSDRIFTDRHIRPNEAKRMVGNVFMVLMLTPMHLIPEEEFANLGCIWEYLSKAESRGINGYPCFFSARFMHKDDWERAVVAIKKEEERRKGIEI